MGFQLAYLHLTLTKSKGYGQGHAHFDSEYLENGDRKNITTAMKQKVMYWLSIGIFTFNPDPF